ncbi:hypothetical protein NL676_008055 [Syzygium grande]|nr:hypothetical protein NL676_008055 [Syzygium grande]
MLQMAKERRISTRKPEQKKNSITRKLAFVEFSSKLAVEVRPPTGGWAAAEVRGGEEEQARRRRRVQELWSF